MFKKIRLRLRFAAAIAFVRCWCMGGVYRNMPKICRELRLRLELSFAFFVYYYVLRLLCDTRWEENM